MGILSKNASPVTEFHIEYLAGSKDVIFGPGSILQGIKTKQQGRLISGHVVFGFKKPMDIEKVGIAFEATTNNIGNPGKESNTQLFSIQDILWDAAPPKGKSPAKDGPATIGESNGALSTSRKKLRPTSGVGHEFLFAIQWPFINYPPSIPTNRSVVQTDYTLRAFTKLSSGEEINSEIQHVDFRPHIDPARVLKYNTNGLEKSETIVKDENGHVLGEAALSCTSDTGTVFGSSCSLNLMLLIRQAESKSLPRKARVEVFEIHKALPLESGKEQRFVLSQEYVPLPSETLKAHQETKIPLKVLIPVAEIDSRRGAMGLPTMSIDGLQVEYQVRVTVSLNTSRLKPSIRSKSIVVQCPVVVANVKPKPHENRRKVPRLVVNVEGEGVWDSQSTASSNFSRDRANGKRDILEWSPNCEIPRFLAGGDMDEDDIF
jgi:hypothetical protein